MRLGYLGFLLFSVIFLISLDSAEGKTITQTMEGGMDLEIVHPESVPIARTFSISILIKNNGWEDKKDISLLLTNPDNSIIPVNKNEIIIERLSTAGSYGRTIDFQISNDASVGTHYLNILYSQVLVKNNEEPQKPTINNIAIPIIIKQLPKINIHTITPDIIFPNAEFPFEVKIISEDIDLQNVSVQIIPPEDIMFQGEDIHSFSSIQKNSPISIMNQIKTPQQDLGTEHKVPFEVIVSYTDDLGDKKIDSKTVPIILRPRTFMEITTDGGIWLGNFFIAPYVSVGTIVAIPAGTLFSLAIKRSLNKKKKSKK